MLKRLLVPLLIITTCCIGFLAQYFHFMPVVEGAQRGQAERARYALRDRGEGKGCESPWADADPALKAAVREDYARVAESAVRRLGDFTHADVRRALQMTDVVHIRIRKNRPELVGDLEASPHSWAVPELIKLIKQAGEACPLPDVDLAFNMLDFPRVYRGSKDDRHLKAAFGEDFEGWRWNTTGEALPIFSATNAPSIGFDDLLLPAPTFNGWRGTYRHHTSHCIPQRESRTCFWRGTTTGFHQGRANHHLGWRYKLVERVWNASGFDVKFSGWAYKSDWHETLQGLREKARFGAYTHIDDIFAKYLCIMDIDGNSYSQRFKNLLIAGAAILKVESPWEEFFHSQFQPDRHFVPVRRDLSNIEAQRERLLRWTADLQYVAKYRAAMALHPEAVYGYICKVLHLYADVLKRSQEPEGSEHRK